MYVVRTSGIYIVTSHRIEIDRYVSYCHVVWVRQRCNPLSLAEVRAVHATPQPRARASLRARGLGSHGPVSFPHPPSHLHLLASIAHIHLSISPLARSRVCVYGCHGYLIPTLTATWLRDGFRQLQSEVILGFVNCDPEPAAGARWASAALVRARTLPVLSERGRVRGLCVWPLWRRA